MRTRQRQPAPPELIEMRRESWCYSNRKPNRAPPADSANRPYLARLWWAAHQAVQRKPNQRTFTYCGVRFGVVFVGHRLGVLDIGRLQVLVLSPTSLPALALIIGNVGRAVNGR